MSQARFLNRHEKKKVLSIQPKTLFLLIVLAFLTGRYSSENNDISDTTMKHPKVVVEEDKSCTVWLRYKIRTDMIKVNLPVCHNSVWADVKLDAQKQLNLPASATPDIWLLHPTLGRLKANQAVQNMTQSDKPVLVYVDSFDSRLELKKRVSIPINLSETLCLIEYENGIYDNTAYQALYDVLYDNSFTVKQTQELRKRLCTSSTQGSRTYYVS